MSGTALDGLRVVEWGSWVSAPYLAKLLADFGADVVKAEPPAGDPARRLGPFPGDVPHPERSGMYLFLNTSKRGVTLDLGSASGRSLLLQLLRDADVFVENNPPALMEELGLTYATLHELNPRLVMTSITAFGQTGPYRDYKTTPLVSYAVGGVAYETPVGGVGEERLESYPPVRGWGWQIAFLAAFNAAWGTLAALRQRAVTGRGQHVDVSEMESGAALLRPNVVEPDYVPQDPGWSKLRRSRPPAGGIYPTRDGHISIGAADEHQWRRLVAVMGDPEWAQSELFATLTARQEHADALHALVSEWTRPQDKVDLARRIQEGGTIAFPVFGPHDVLADEQNRVREVFVEHEHPDAGRVRMPGAPFRLSATPWRIARPAPRLGEHNEEILCGRLGLTREQLVRLRGAGAI